MNFENVVKKLSEKVKTKTKLRYQDMAKELLAHFKAQDEVALSEWLEGFSKNVRHGNEKDVTPGKNGGSK